MGAAGRSTLRTCRPDYCAGGADLGLLGWAGSLRVGVPVGAAGRPTLRACRPGFVVVVVDLGLLGWAGSLRVGAPVGAAGRPTLRACRSSFGVGVVDLAPRGYMCLGVLFGHCILPSVLHRPYCLRYSLTFSPYFFSHDGMEPMGNRRWADGNRRQLVLTVPTRWTSATRATADEQSNRTSRQTKFFGWAEYT